MNFTVFNDKHFGKCLSYCYTMLKKGKRIQKEIHMAYSFCNPSDGIIKYSRNQQDHRQKLDYLIVKTQPVSK